MNKKIMSALSTASSAASSAAELLRLFRPRSSAAVSIISHTATFLAGIAVGTAAGLMLAPKSGRELRADLRAGVRDIGNELRTTASAVKETARRAVSESEVEVADANTEPNGDTSEPMIAPH